MRAGGLGLRRGCLPSLRPTLATVLGGMHNTGRIPVDLNSQRREQVVEEGDRCVAG